MNDSGKIEVTVYYVTQHQPKEKKNYLKMLPLVADRKMDFPIVSFEKILNDKGSK